MIKRLLARWTDGPWSATAILLVGVVLAFAPDAFLTMLARAFLLQWTLFFGVLLLLCVWRKAWWSGGAALVAGLLTLYPPTTEAPAAATMGANALRVAQMNVFQPNDDHADVVEAALASGADVISFQEVDPAWAEALRNGLDAAYPYHVIEPRGNCYGIALFSKLSFTESQVLLLEGTPAVDVRIGTPQGPLRLLAVHAESPGSYGSFQRRNRQLERLAKLIGEGDVPTVVVGDLNTVSWDQALRRLCYRSGLREGYDAPAATWPSVMGLALIPLDHVLVSRGLGVNAVSPFRIPGSDHKGLVAQLARQ